MGGSQGDLGPPLVAECIVMIVLSSMAIALRFWSRALLPRDKFGADDWTALGAWPFVMAALALLIAWAFHGLGQHSVALTPYILKLLLAKELVWNTGITLTRISALLFYKRLFQRQSKTLFWLGIAFNVVWFVMLLFLVIFGCSPVPRIWDRAVPGTCLPELPGQIISSFTSLVLDLYILVVPLPMLWRLQMKTPRKVAVALVLILGYSVPVLSLGRFITTLKNSRAFDNDLNWGFGEQEFWSICEISVSFIGITVPGVFNLVKRALRHGPSSLFNDREYPLSQKSWAEEQRERSTPGLVPLSTSNGVGNSSEDEQQCSLSGTSDSSRQKKEEEARFTSQEMLQPKNLSGSILVV